MYRQIYNPHLVDGLNLVDRMTRLPKGSDFASQLNKIEDWKKSVQGQVDKIIEKVSPDSPSLLWFFVQNLAIRYTY
jgi:hypothetical protein